MPAGDGEQVLAAHVNIDAVDTDGAHPLLGQVVREGDILQAQERAVLVAIRIDGRVGIVERVDTTRIAWCPEIVHLLGQAVVTQCVIVDELGKRVLTHKALAATQNGVEEEAQCNGPSR